MTPAQLTAVGSFVAAVVAGAATWLGARVAQRRAEHEVPKTITDAAGAVVALMRSQLEAAVKAHADGQEQCRAEIAALAERHRVDQEECRREIAALKARLFGG